ncbi:MAG: DUF2142 domain-containing protein [Nocardioides sp.]|nr:DUF2142 domain-containing protein [Nocardioides sp.]
MPWGRSRAVALWAVVCMAAMAALTGWAVSPPGSSPDDDYHLASIWCADGIVAGRCEAIEDRPDARLLPRLATGAAICYALDNTVSGSCQKGMAAPDPDVDIEHGNWGGAYPPYFYSFLSTFVGSDVQRAVLTMRLANAALIVALVTLLAALLPRRRRPLAVVPLVVTAVPLSMSILASINPSSWAVVGAALLWPALYVAFETTGRRQWALSGFAVLAAFIGSGSRADGCLFVLMSIALVLLLRVRHLRRALVPSLAAGVGLVIAASIFLTSGHASAVTEGLGYTRIELTTTQLLLINLSSLPTLWFGMLGSGPMGRTGWLDTVYPPMVSALGVATWFGLVLGGLRRMFPAKLVGLVLIGGALVVYPMALLIGSHVLVGEGVQPRYLLPMMVIFTGLALLGVRGSLPRLGPRWYWAAVGALGLAHTVALHIHIRRYVTGLDVSRILFGNDLEWWWGVGPSATSVWLVSSIGFIVLSAAALRPLRADRDPRPGSAPAGSGAGRSSVTP